MCSNHSHILFIHHGVYGCQGFVFARAVGYNLLVMGEHDLQEHALAEARHAYSRTREIGDRVALVLGIPAGGAAAVGGYAVTKFIEGGYLNVPMDQIQFSLASPQLKEVAIGMAVGVAVGYLVNRAVKGFMDFQALRQGDQRIIDNTVRGGRRTNNSAADRALREQKIKRQDYPRRRDKGLKAIREAREKRRRR